MSTCAALIKATTTMLTMLQLSTETPNTVPGAYVSPADQLRNSATYIDAKDKAIIAVRVALPDCQAAK